VQKSLRFPLLIFAIFFFLEMQDSKAPSANREDWQKRKGPNHGKKAAKFRV
jgi:hypothetical protein